jgi:hypothetical protein
VLVKYFHLIVGISLLIVFLITGRFMRIDFPDKEIIPQDLRILMRSRHIYILFSALIHLTLGVYLTINPTTWRKILQYLGSVLLTFASILLVWAFVHETYYTKTFSELSRQGIYLSLAGTLFHFIGNLMQKPAS